jgi:hypothetical protein
VFSPVDSLLRLIFREKISCDKVLRVLLTKIVGDTRANVGGQKKMALQTDAGELLCLSTLGSLSSNFSEPVTSRHEISK